MTSMLVIDDDPVMREVLRALLEASGFDVAVAADGADGLAQLADARPDAVMVDSQMPGIGGRDVVRRLRADRATGHLAVVLMSGESADEEVAAGLAAGADQYLVKPFTPDDVFVALSQAIAARPPGPGSG